MAIGRIVLALAGASSSLYLLFSEMQRMQNRKATRKRLKLIGEALEQAEERAVRYEERHDRILNQICSYYMINQSLEDALAGAKDAMNEALDFAVCLRKLQLQILSSFSP